MSGGRRARAALGALWTQLDLFGRWLGGEPRPVAPPEPVAPPPARRRAAPPAAVPALEDGRWRWTRPWLESPHRPRARRELEAVRAHFPELDGVVITVGLTKRRNVLGLASLGEVPILWIRPRRIHRFALAHELVHLLQARGLVPGGEKAADLYALARTAAYVDVSPFYLRVPRRLAGPRGVIAPDVALALHEHAARAVAGRRGKTARGAVLAFERAVAETWGA